MNGSEIEQTSIAAGSTVTECDEPPGNNYRTSFSFENLPLFRSAEAEQSAAVIVAKVPVEDAGVNRRVQATPTRRNRPNLRTRAFRRAYYPEIKDADWNDWRWQSRHRVRKLEQIERMLVLSDDEREALIKGASMLPVGITPYYMSLLDRDVHSNSRRG
jgi:lysine 2,3-aminomutase